MLPGYNHNVAHRGETFHIQSEDMGLSNPQIITHLFHGGDILASEKCSYQDLLASDAATEQIRERMQQQHKNMMRALIKGSFDEILLQRFPHLVPITTPPPKPPTLSIKASPLPPIEAQDTSPHIDIPPPRAPKTARIATTVAASNQELHQAPPLAPLQRPRTQSVTATPKSTSDFLDLIDGDVSVDPLLEELLDDRPR